MLQVRDVSKWFGDVKVLDRINFNLNRGDRAGLVGPNGCGKTTLLRILTGELASDRGSVRLVPGSPRVGYLPQALDFPDDATVGAVLPRGPRPGRKYSRCTRNSRDAPGAAG